MTRDDRAGQPHATPLYAATSAKVSLELSGLEHGVRSLDPKSVAEDVAIAVHSFDDDVSYEPALVAICVLRATAEDGGNEHYSFRHWALRSRYSRHGGIAVHLVAAAYAGLTSEYGIGFFDGNPREVQFKIHRVARVLGKYEEELLRDGVSWAKRSSGVERVRKAIWLKRPAILRPTVGLTLAGGTSALLVLAATLLWPHSEEDEASPSSSEVASSDQAFVSTDMNGVNHNLKVSTLVFTSDWRPPESGGSVSGTDGIQTVAVTPGQELIVDVTVGLRDMSKFETGAYSDLIVSVHVPSKIRLSEGATMVFNESYPNGLAIQEQLGKDEVQVELSQDGGGVSYRSFFSVAEPSQFACGRNPLVIETWFYSQRVWVMSPNIIYVDNDCSR